MKVYAIQNLDQTIRNTSSAGGVFSILAENVIKLGGVVYGVGFDDEWNVCHKRVISFDGIADLRGSKYVYSKLGSTIKQALEDLSSGRYVLFSGTPCQAAAIRKLSPENNRLLIVEVVCHGAPNPEYWSKYLDGICQQTKHQRADIKTISFRDKRTGWKTYSFTVKFKDGFEFTERGGDNLYMRAFIRDLTLREACFRCKFKQPYGSKADITLGDFWGIENIVPKFDNNLGTTIAIASTAKGERALSDLHKLCELDYNEVVKYNPAICNPALKPKQYGAFIADASTSSVLLPVLKRYVGHSLKEQIKKTINRLLGRN